ncbi:MAG: hypothetical protein OSA11_09485 [Candidatus Nanopelagicales bacterium]|nr:hypothetical protein [Candidatus Nanopelagicales bacterium]MDE1046379.1 hypothetical protein [Candidatus Nanopelagicales bacterium]
MNEQGASKESENPRLAELQSEIEVARAAFINSVTQLREQTAPGLLAQRGLHAAQGWFTDDFGAIRTKRVAIAGAVVVGVVAIKLLRRRG